MYLTKVANVLATSCSFNLIRTTSSTLWTRAMFCTMPASPGSSYYHILEQRTGEFAEPWGRTANIYCCPVQWNASLSDKNKDGFAKLMVTYHIPEDIPTCCNKNPASTPTAGMGLLFDELAEVYCHPPESFWVFRNQFGQLNCKRVGTTVLYLLSI